MTLGLKILLANLSFHLSLLSSLLFIYLFIARFHILEVLSFMGTHGSIPT